MRRAARSIVVIAVLVAGACLVASPALGVEFKEATEAARAGDYAKVVFLLDDYIPEHPKDMRGYALRGRALVEMGQHQNALADLDKVVAADFGADGGMPLYNRGRAHFGLGDSDKALADFDKSIEANSKQPERFVARGKVRWFQRETDKARADFDKAIELDAKHAPAWASRGRMRFEAAVEMVTYVYQRDGQTYQAQRPGKIKDRAAANEAVDDLSKAIELSPSDTDPLGVRMRAYQLMGDRPGKALADLKTMCRLMPHESSLWRELSWELATNPAKPLRNGKEAVEAAEKAAKLCNPVTAECHETLAAAQAEAGDFDKAVVAQTKVVEATKDEARKKVMQERLELFRSKKPYHRPKAAG